MSGSTSLRLASFNILHGQTVSSAAAHSTAHHSSPADGPPDSDALLSAVREINADVLGLQEVDRNQPRSGHADQAALVSAGIGAEHWQFLPTVIGTPGGVDSFRPATLAERAADFVATHPDYGVALVSRYPVTKWHNTTFPAAPLSLPLLVQTDGRPRVLRVRDEQRAVIAAQIETPHGAVTVVTAHLSFVPGFNVKQLRRITRWVASLPRPLVLLGDFNLPAGIPASVTGMTPLLRQPTFPSYKPRVQFDHILVDGFTPAQISDAKSSAKVWPLAVSDHCAVSIDLRL